MPVGGSYGAAFRTGTPNNNIQIFYASVVKAWPSMAGTPLGGATYQTQTVTCPGARIGDKADCWMSINMLGIALTAAVTASDVITVTAQNVSGGVIAPASGTLYVTATRYVL